MKTNKQIQDQLMKNLIKCLNTKSSFSQVGQAFSQAIGAKPVTKNLNHQYNNKPKMKIKKNKA